MIPATSKSRASHWMTLKERLRTSLISTAMIKILRLPSILAVVGLKNSCIANFRELLIAYSPAGTAKSRLWRASRTNDRIDWYIGLPGRPVPCQIQKQAITTAVVLLRRPAQLPHCSASYISWCMIAGKIHHKFLLHEVMLQVYFVLQRLRKQTTFHENPALTLYHTWTLQGAR